MKFLALIGSPRKGGNTDLLVDALLQGAREAGAGTEKLYLAGLDIAPCDACRGCQPDGDCVRQDGMTPLYEKLQDSDVWVLGTPVYWWGPSAQLKLVIDRWYPFAREGRHRVRGKRALLVCPFADADPGTPRHVVGMLEDTFAYLGMEFSGRLLTSVRELGEVAGKPAVLKEACELGRRTASSR